MTTRFIPAPGDAAQPAGEQNWDELRTALLEQRQFRIEQLRELDTVSSTEHPADATLEEVTATLRTAARTALAEVDAALGRMEIGEYGICQDCGADIALARLEIVPMTARCMPCQRLSETEAPDVDPV
jgi:RNA polymerase-binding protein DksA